MVRVARILIVAHLALGPLLAISMLFSSLSAQLDW